MSEDKKDILEELGINDGEVLDVPEELKGGISKMLTNMIGSTLEFHKILEAGVNYSMCPVQVIPTSELERGEPSIPESVLEFVDNAAFAFAGSMTKEGMDNKDIEYFVIVDKDNRLGIHTFNKAIDNAAIERLITHLAITGLESHKLIKHVLHAGNFIMPEGKRVLAYGGGAHVEMGEDNSYAIRFSAPDDIIPVIGKAAGQALKDKIPGMEVDAKDMCESEDSKPCNCLGCQLMAMAGGKKATEEGNVH